MQGFSNLNARRERLGITQKHLCSVAEVNASNLSRLKKDGREPSPRIMRKLETALQKIADERGVMLDEPADEGRAA